MKPSRLAFAVLVVLVVACRHDQLVGPRQASRYFDLRMTAPGERTGALLVLLQGGVIDSVTSPALDVTTLETGAGEYGVVVRGRLRAGAMLRLWVPDPSILYRATIAQVTEGYQRSEASGYGFNRVTPGATPAAPPPRSSPRSGPVRAGVVLPSVP